MITILSAPAPVCDECEVELARVGRHEHRYWSCGYCGNTVRGAA